MAFVGTFFAAAGRLSVRLRWVILLAWVAGVATSERFKVSDLTHEAVYLSAIESSSASGQDTT